jgi:predicted XRE-type DNA-binding protein
MSDAIDLRGLTQTEAAKIMNISQPDLSKLLRGRTMSFSIDRLVSMLKDLGVDVDVIVHDRSLRDQARGQLRVLQVVG